MSKYIPADKLIVEIERLSSSEHPIEYEPIEKLAYNRALLEIEGAITSLQQEQPEVDLEDIIRVEFGTRAKVEDGRRYVKLNWDKFSIIARHFYELGLNARKE